MTYNRVTYLFEWNGLEVVVSEPTNWDEDEKSFVRNKIFHGIAIDVTESLIFVKDARDFLIDALATDGPNANVKITRMEADPQTDIMAVDYVGYIDFNTYDIGEDDFRVKLNADPFLARFKSKLSSKVELERLTSLKGTLLEPLNLETIYFLGRAILITSKWAQAVIPIMTLRTFSDTIEYIQALSITELGDNDEGLLYAFSQTQNEWVAGKDNITADMCFLLSNDSIYDLTYHVSVNIKQSIYVEGNQQCVFKIKIVRTENNQNFDWLEDIILYEKTGLSQDIPKEITVSYNEDLIALPGQAFSLQYSLTGITGDDTAIFWEYPWENPNAASGHSGVKGTYINSNGEWASAFYEASVVAQEDSERKPSNSPCIKIYDVAKRLNDICVEADFESDLLSSADISKTIVLHGMWLRGSYAGVKNYKPISTTFTDFLASLNAIYPIGLDINNGKMKIEGRSYFYQNYVTIDLGEVSELHIKPDSEDYMTSIEAGPVKSGAYDESQGLDEYNRKTQYDTILDKTDNILELTHVYKTDSYGLESIRRDHPEVGLQVNPDDDSKYDDDKWFVDAVLPSGQTAYEPGHWSERFAKAPTGVYSPETAFNFWFSPINIILRHGPWIKPALLHYLESFVAYNSSDGNSALVTQLIGGNTYTQNVGIQVIDFDRSMHKAKLATFKAPISWAQLNGTTLNRPNRYGQVQFTRFGIKYRGFMMEVKTAEGIGDFIVKLATSTSTI